ncbi:dehydrodolichyl diphosphate synthase 2-like protein [Tanacetum coccineum]
MDTFLLSTSSLSMFASRNNILPGSKLIRNPVTKNRSRKPYTLYDYAITKSYLNTPSASISTKEGNKAELEYQALCNGLRAESIPKHVALLMDGQRRLAKESDLPHELSHSVGCPSLMDIARICCELRIKGGVDLAINITKLDLDELSRNDIKVSVIGNRSAIPDSQLQMLTHMEETTKNNKTLHIIEAIEYNGRLDMVQACITLAKKVSDGLIQPTEIDGDVFEQELETKFLEFPNPDLVIRTGGKYNVENFMLWQAAYSEFCFIEKDALQFDKIDFIEALDVHEKRNRPFGGSEKKKLLRRLCKLRRCKLV